jgi:hypothetical protein
LYCYTEVEKGTAPLPKYCLYEDDKGSWRIQAIPLTPSSFENRKPLPKAWMGIRDTALDELSGIDVGALYKLNPVDSWRAFLSLLRAACVLRSDKPASVTTHRLKAVWFQPLSL